MIVLTCQAIGRFRAVAKRCVVGRPRGPAPPIIVEQTADAVTLFSEFGDVALALRLPSAKGTPDQRLAVPASLLDEIHGGGGEEVYLDGASDISGRCTWPGGRSSRWDSLPIPEGSGPWPLPPNLKPVDPTLLAALHECGRSAAKESVRYVLHRVQIQGKAGNVAGTDGRQLLLWNGFRFPFPESLLVAAVPVFGSPELGAEDDVGVGRSDSHVVVTAGPWMIWLRIEREGRYPDVAQVIPRSAATEVSMNPTDLALVAAALKRCPANGADDVDATLDCGSSVAVRFRLGADAPVSEVCLLQSTCVGPELQVALQPRHLGRAASLGLGRVQIPSENGPVVFQDERRTYVATCFAAPRVLARKEPGRTAVPAASALVLTPLSLPTQGEVCMASEPNGRARDEPAADPMDLMAEAEALRDALNEVARRAARLVGSLRHFQKQRRVLESAWSSLKNLRLGP